MPRLRNPRKTPRISAAALTQRVSGGEAVYHKYRCDSCHGETGLALCDLRVAHRKYPIDAQLVAFIKNPARTVPGSKMPAWQDVIQEDEYAALAAYVRSLGEGRAVASR